MTQKMIIIAIIAVGLIIFFFARTKTSTDASGNIIIENPKILLIQVGDNSASQIEMDKTIYSDYFADIKIESVKDTKDLQQFLSSSTFDLVHLFVDVNENGNIFTLPSDQVELGKIIDILQSRKTSYILFGRGELNGGYEKGAKGKDFTANIVMTLDRKGNNFHDFFKSVFRAISTGKTFPVAWNDLAPQIPGLEHENSPSCIAVMGAGSVILKGNK